MNTFNSIVAYMAISGIFLGPALDRVLEKCGNPVDYSIERAAAALLWPQALVVWFYIDTEDLKKSSCQNNGN